MANVRIELQVPIVDGQTLTFKSPADCSQVTGLIVYYPENDSTVSKTFQFADAHGNNVGSIDLFAENVLVKVILDTELNRAYVQNADTNGYLENALADARTRTLVQVRKGFSIVADNCSQTSFKEIKVFGRTAYLDIPTPDTPAPLVGIGSTSNLEVYIKASETSEEFQTISINTPGLGGVHGFPVTSGGNYTDDRGQQWVCDEIDIVRGVFIRRICNDAIGPGLIDSIEGTTVRYAIMDSGLSLIPQIYCDRFRDGGACADISDAEASLQEGYFSYSCDSEGFLQYLYFKHSAFTDLDTARDWFGNHQTGYLIPYVNFSIYLPLADKTGAVLKVSPYSYEPRTIVSNNMDADMEINYCSPYTAVPMVQSSEDAGKILAVDERGCVLPVDRDYVVVENTSGKWAYRKWASGIAECWGTFDAKYVRAMELRETVSLPFDFITRTATGSVWGTSWVDTGVLRLTHYKGSVEIVLYSPGSNYNEGASMGVSVYVIGRWK